jgi:hypothetical protein
VDPGSEKPEAERFEERELLGVAAEQRVVVYHATRRDPAVVRRDGGAGCHRAARKPAPCLHDFVVAMEELEAVRVSQQLVYPRPAPPSHVAPLPPLGVGTNVSVGILSRSFSWAVGSSLPRHSSEAMSVSSTTRLRGMAATIVRVRPCR